MPGWPCGLRTFLKNTILQSLIPGARPQLERIANHKIENYVHPGNRTYHAFEMVIVINLVKFQIVKMF